MSITLKDRELLWHPYTQMQTGNDAVAIVRGEGAYLYDQSGKKYIDAISSWWTNLHGHCHPFIIRKVQEQLNTLDHVLFAGFTHAPAVELADNLLQVLPKNQKRIFYSDNGSTAVEVALKMAVQYWHNKDKQRIKIIALENAYHGDTFGAMSTSGRSIFTNPYNELLFEVIHISTENFNSGVFAEDVAAFIYEPLVQGTAGMVMYDKGFLEKALSACDRYGILKIADEVMTGFGRTGRIFASDYLSIQPDIICLSKGITGGVLPLGVTSCTAGIYNAFLSDNKSKMFFHGHSYTANPIACSAAVASLQLLLNKETQESISRISRMHSEYRTSLKSSAVKNARSLGTILAIELNTIEQTNYMNTLRDQLYKFFINKGIIIRPLGNIIYLMPPYCISNEDLKFIYATIDEMISTYSTTGSI